MITKGGWKIIVILFAFVVRVKGDNLNELLSLVKNLHEKVDQIGMEQVKTHEKVEQLETELNQLRLAVKSKPENVFYEKVSATTSNLTMLNHKLLEMEEKMDKANEAILQKLDEIIVGTNATTTTITTTTTTTTNTTTATLGCRV